MKIIFEITDKSGRKIRLTSKQWAHINNKHPSVANYFKEIKEILQKPDVITDSDIDENVHFYYKYYKYLEPPHKYILVIVKYLNGEGFIISAFFEKSIK